MTANFIAGVDEAGRGALAGPVVAAAVLFQASPRIGGLTDSKRLTVASRRNLETIIKRQCTCWAVGLASVTEIDQLNVLQATLLAMQRAINRLTTRPNRVLVDGTHLPKINISAEAIVKGDLTEPVISAASIIAKETRDAIMLDYSTRYPEYGFDQHVGYGTPMHLRSLAEHGATGIHRQTFAPVRKLRQTHSPRGDF